MEISIGQEQLNLFYQNLLKPVFDDYSQRLQNLEEINQNLMVLVQQLHSQIITPAKSNTQNKMHNLKVSQSSTQLSSNTKQVLQQSGNQLQNTSKTLSQSTSQLTNTSNSKIKKDAIQIKSQNKIDSITNDKFNDEKQKDKTIDKQSQESLNPNNQKKNPQNGPNNQIQDNIQIKQNNNNNNIHINTNKIKQQKQNEQQPLSQRNRAQTITETKLNVSQVQIKSKDNNKQKLPQKQNNKANQQKSDQIPACEEKSEINTSILEKLKVQEQDFESDFNLLADDPMDKKNIQQKDSTQLINQCESQFQELLQIYTMNQKSTDQQQEISTIKLTGWMDDYMKGVIDLTYIDDIIKTDWPNIQILDIFEVWLNLNKVNIQRKDDKKFWSDVKVYLNTKQNQLGIYIYLGDRFKDQLLLFDTEINMDILISLEQWIQKYPHIIQQETHEQYDVVTGALSCIFKGISAHFGLIDDQSNEANVIFKRKCFQIQKNRYQIEQLMTLLNQLLEEIKNLN